MLDRTIYTVGHSTRQLDDFIEILTNFSIRTLADVRLIPRSRRHPHFNNSALAVSLPQAGIEYASFAELGGRRKPVADSINTGWRNESFRGYADYLQTREFNDALGRLENLATQSTTAIMCAEAVPWQCHRSLIADALLIRGWTVIDIMSASQSKPHALTPFARVNGHQLTYPSHDEELFRSR